MNFIRLEKKHKDLMIIAVNKLFNHYSGAEEGAHRFCRASTERYNIHS